MKLIDFYRVVIFSLLFIGIRVAYPHVLYYIENVPEIQDAILAISFGTAIAIFYRAWEGR